MVTFLGPPYIKIIQILSTRADIFSDEFIRICGQLRVNVPGPSFSRIKSSIPSSLADAIRTKQISIEEEPIAGGSVAVVYKGIDIGTSNPLAIKIIRPNAKLLITTDIKILVFFSFYLRLIPWLKPIPMQSALRFVGNALIEQTNLELERRNLNRFTELTTENNKIVFPIAWPDYSNENTLVMGYLSNFNEEWLYNMTAEQGSVISDSLVHMLFNMVFVEGFIHSDLHPGNIGVDQRGFIRIVDTGLVAQLNSMDRKQFARFFFGMVSNNGLMSAKVLNETAEKSLKIFDKQMFDIEVSSIIAKYSGLSAADYDVALFVSEIFQVQRKHGLVATPTFLTVILAFVSLEGIIKIICPAYDFQEKAKQYIFRYSQAVGLFEAT